MVWLSLKFRGVLGLSYCRTSLARTFPVWLSSWRRGITKNVATKNFYFKFENEFCVKWALLSHSKWRLQMFECFFWGSFKVLRCQYQAFWDKLFFFKQSWLYNLFSPHNRSTSWSRRTRSWRGRSRGGRASWWTPRRPTASPRSRRPWEVRILIHSSGF